MLIASIVLQQAKEVCTEKINNEHKILTYMVAILHHRKSKLCRGCILSNAVKIMIFILDVNIMYLLKLCKTAGSIHLFKISGMLNSENIKLNKNYT